jgi:hypothetical protein
MGESLFGQLLGSSFAELPLAIRNVHDVRSKRLLGRADVTRGTHWLVRWLAPFASLPATCRDIPIGVQIDVHRHGETWSRSFNGYSMQSHLRAAGPMLAERLGAMTLFFILDADASGIRWRVTGAKCLGVPLPTRWFTSAVASESVLEDRYHFDVHASLPRVGLLVHYRGWLAE